MFYDSLLFWFLSLRKLFVGSWARVISQRENTCPAGTRLRAQYPALKKKKPSREEGVHGKYRISILSPSVAMTSLVLVVFSSQWRLSELDIGPQMCLAIWIPRDLNYMIAMPRLPRCGALEGRPRAASVQSFAVASYVFLLPFDFDALSALLLCLSSKEPFSLYL